jgi:hypothetical protein
MKKKEMRERMKKKKTCQEKFSFSLCFLPAKQKITIKKGRLCTRAKKI